MTYAMPLHTSRGGVWVDIAADVKCGREALPLFIRYGYILLHYWCEVFAGMPSAATVWVM